ncbi:hypothetical protein OF364_02770 [Mycoplasma enhydrae]|uniref:hypothetical protein n=1 Tax=Mycoplasma enhydrae TaxID=2499220 RepID=UPI0021E91A8E|nr:hypothetical protein [Mycoplasma enhydrae]MCV3753725.1 hypothetical protein [Mycoplasma enhydrae]
MANKVTKLLKISSITSAPLLLSPVVVVSCAKKTLKSDNKSAEFKDIKKDVDNLKWEDFLLSKKIKELNKNYKDYTYETFFEFGKDDSLKSLNEIELNDQTGNLSSKEAKAIDVDSLKKDYISHEVLNKIDKYNENQPEDKKIILILRSQKLPRPESAILVWIWLTEKQYLSKASQITDLQKYSERKIPLYGHWFYNEEYDKTKKSTNAWRIVSYVVPAIAITWLLLYVLIMYLIKRKKKANLNTKRRNYK